MSTSGGQLCMVVIQVMEKAPMEFSEIIQIVLDF